MEDNKVFMAEEDFGGLCRAVYPLLHKIGTELEKHNVPDMVSITLTKDGYINLSVYDTGWSLIRTREDSNVKMRHEFRKDFIFEEDKQDGIQR